jgi:hypothetical protein
MHGDIDVQEPTRQAWFLISRIVVDKYLALLKNEYHFLKTLILDLKYLSSLNFTKIFHLGY